MLFLFCFAGCCPVFPKPFVEEPFFKFIYLFLREREREHAEEGQREMETENPTHALNCPEIITWAELTITCFVDWATPVSQDYLFFHWMFFPALLRINWPYRCEFISAFLFYWSMPLCFVVVVLSVPYCSDQYSFVL